MQEQGDMTKLVYRQMTRGWAVQARFGLDGPSVALVCECGEPTPTEQGRALVCNKCGRAVTMLQATDMFKEVSEQLADLCINLKPEGETGAGSLWHP